MPKPPIPQEAKSVDRPQCGIVMPISALDGYSEQHWSEVKSILSDSIESAGFIANLVSDADDVGIIQKRIIQNLYENPIVVCDVSGKNPNVMFELGMRLAFDKPTIIVKDNATSYSFDTSPIEHLEYPSDLRFGKIVAFKESLAEKIKGTFLKSKSDPNFTTFLKNFGTFSIAKLDTQEVSKEDFIIDELRDISRLLRRQISDFDRSNEIRRSAHNFDMATLVEMVVNDIIDSAPEGIVIEITPDLVLKNLHARFPETRHYLINPSLIKESISRGLRRHQ